MSNINSINLSHKQVTYQLPLTYFYSDLVEVHLLTNFYTELVEVHLLNQYTLKQ